MAYEPMELDEAYRLINTGPVVLICTVSNDGMYNVSPVAWVSPVRKTPTCIMINASKRRKTFQNIKQTGIFAAGIPNISQVEMIKSAASFSGDGEDKFEKCRIPSIAGMEIDCRVPEGMVGYIECRVKDIYDSGMLAAVVGEAVYAAVESEAYDGSRLLSENPAGKTVYHLGNQRFMTLGDQIFE